RSDEKAASVAAHGEIDEAEYRLAARIAGSPPHAVDAPEAPFEVMAAGFRRGFARGVAPLLGTLGAIRCHILRGRRAEVGVGPPRASKAHTLPGGQTFTTAIPNPAIVAFAPRNARRNHAPLFESAAAAISPQIHARIEVHTRLRDAQAVRA